MPAPTTAADRATTVVNSKLKLIGKIQPVLNTNSLINLSLKLVIAYQNLVVGRLSRVVILMLTAIQLWISQLLVKNVNSFQTVQMVHL